MQVRGIWHLGERSGTGSQIVLLEGILPSHPDLLHHHLRPLTAHSRRRHCGGGWCWGRLSMRGQVCREWVTPCACAETEAPLPRWVIMEASGVALKLRSEQATRAFFVDLAGLLSAVAHACASAGAWPHVSLEAAAIHRVTVTSCSSQDSHAMSCATLSLRI